MGANHAGDRKRQKAKRTKKNWETRLRKLAANPAASTAAAEAGATTATAAN
jgi:hypothetical protein